MTGFMDFTCKLFKYNSQIGILTYISTSNIYNKHLIISFKFHFLCRYVYITLDHCNI